MQLARRPVIDGKAPGEALFLNASGYECGSGSETDEEQSVNDTSVHGGCQNVGSGDATSAIEGQ